MSKIGKRLFRGLNVLAVVGALLFVDSTQASAADSQWAMFKPRHGLYQQAHGLCLDAIDEDGGIRVGIWGCHGGDNQFWQFVDLGGGLYTIRNKAYPDKCVTTSFDVSKALPCGHPDYDDYQIFVRWTWPYDTGFYAIASTENPSRLACLHVPLGSVQNGADVASSSFAAQCVQGQIFPYLYGQWGFYWSL